MPQDATVGCIWSSFLLILNHNRRKMKKILSICLLLTLGQLVMAQNETATTAADPLKTNKTEHDFGQIAQGKPVYTEFQITNSGTTPLRLEDVRAACGCTTPEWSRDAIAPGATAVIKVGFNAATEGPFSKPVTITYNNGRQSRTLMIKGTVWKAPEGAAPANAAVQFLKKQNF